MIKRLQTNNFFAVHCQENEDGFLCGVVFISDKNKSSNLNILNPDTGERFNLSVPLSGYYTNLQLSFK
jgi:hypothetical protein